jgi:dihydroorotate dehydrogenase
MKEVIIKIRNLIIGFLYKTIFKNIAFLFDAEKTHDAILRFGYFLGKNNITRKTVSVFFNYSHPLLKQEIHGIHFKNPVGLAAGFDKNAELLDIIPEVGFGFMEIGSITGEPCEGNPKPRLWRLKKSKSLCVYYGLKNDGAEIISKKMANRSFKIPVGISIAKTNSPKTVETQSGIKDYLKVCKYFLNIGDYWTINISCPNSFGGEPFTDPVKLDLLLAEIDKIKPKKPVFLKISPDLSFKEIDDILEVSKKHCVKGFVCTNLTKIRPGNLKDKVIPKKGGLSGKVVADLSNKVISYIYKKTEGKFVIIGVGGIFSAKDAFEKILCGASLLQLITGMIFEGPQLISSINLGLVELLKKHKLKSIKEAVGKNLF